MFVILLNPAAGNGRAKGVFEKIRQSPLFVEKDCRTFVTNDKGHGESLAQQVAEMYKEKIKCIIVIGGDGTMHEVLNGLKNYPKTKLAFIPGGSGNDFARGTKVRQDPVALFERIVLAKRFAPYICGVYRTDFRKQNHSRLFANSIGFGFDGEVAQKANHSRLKRWLNRWNLGFLTYCIALVQTLFSFQPKSIELTIDGETRSFDEVWMITSGIHGYYGGGMKILPQANVRDGRTPILILRGISKWKVLFLFVTVFWGGHIRFKEVEILKGQTITITSPTPLLYQVDGEAGACHTCWITREDQSRGVLQGKK